MKRPFLAGCESTIRLMATTLILPPAVDPERITQCVDRWREQRIADVAIDEFGDEARAQAGDRLHRTAGDAGRIVSPPAISASTTERHPGVRVSGTAYPHQEARHVA